MTKKHSTKRSLIASILILCLCITSLVGTTFAWFTDEVTSSGNKIVSGSLKVDLEVLNKETKAWASIKDDHTPIFNYENWEPGYIDAKILKVDNEGSLALKWKAKFISDSALSELANVIDVYVLPYGVLTVEDAATKVAYPTRELKDYIRVGTLSEFVNTIESTTYGNLLAGESAYLGIALKMQESAGNEYQEKTIGAFDIQIVATQMAHENDSFGNDYDADATFPLGQPVSTETQNTTLSAKIEVPATAPAGEYTVSMPEESIEITSVGEDVSVKFDLNLLCDGEKVTGTGNSYTVTLKIPVSHRFIQITEVIHNGEQITDYTYNPETAEITFVTSHFSPFEIKFEDYVDPSFELEYTEDDNGKFTITNGVFVNQNPAEYDKSLAAADSKYIAVDYVKDGVKYYVVSERANTVFISNDSNVSTITKDNGTFDVTYVAPGKLYSFFSGLKNNDFNTVYILPGTYTEGTTLGVFSSMDIIGLGDTDEVKIIKGASNGSNQHLFNVSGTKEDYIHVTFRNLYLDASEYNVKDGKNRDNAAVQSIRKSMVKCYDLTVVKNTAKMDQYAFYVNAKNDANGQYQNAYMYVENCNAIVRGDTWVMTGNNGQYPNTHAKWYFYHSGLTVNGVAYTKNSGNNKNINMAPNDWWD